MIFGEILNVEISSDIRKTLIELEQRPIWNRIKYKNTKTKKKSLNS